MILDIIIIALFTVLTIRGGAKGLIDETFSLTAVVASLILATSFNGQIEKLIVSASGRHAWDHAVSFALAFFLSLTLFAIIRNAAKTLLQKLNISCLDRLLGFVIGFVEAAFICGVLVYLLAVQPFFNPDSLLANSHLGLDFLYYVEQARSALEAA